MFWRKDLRQFHQLIFSAEFDGVQHRCSSECGLQMPADNYNRDLRDTLEAIIARCEGSPDPRGELHQQMAQAKLSFATEDVGRMLREAMRRLQLAE